jgi:hypothetical protein
LLLAATLPISAAELANQFVRGNGDRIGEVLESLVITGSG